MLLSLFLGQMSVPSEVVDSGRVYQDSQSIHVVSSLKQKERYTPIESEQIQTTCLTKTSLNDDLLDQSIDVGGAAVLQDVNAPMPKKRTRLADDYDHDTADADMPKNAGAYTRISDAAADNSVLLQNVLWEDPNRTYYAAMKKTNGITVRMGDVVSVWTNPCVPGEVSYCQVVVLWRTKSDSACLVAGRWFESYESLQPYLTKTMKR